MVDKYYLVSFEVNSDGDFGFEDYNDLNDRKFISTESMEDLKKVILKHFKHVIDTFFTDRDYIEHIKDDMKKLYKFLEEGGNKTHLYDPYNITDDENLFYFYQTFGNQYIEYYIEEIPLLSIEE